MKGLNDKRVWITGAASGIGFATAQRFQAEGARLFLIDVSPIEGFKDAVCLQADLTREEDMQRIEAAISEHGMDVLINNAGITRDATAVKMSMGDWDKVIAVNLTAVFRMAQLAARVMRAQGSGVILNAASVVAHYGNFGQANYSATKGGVIAMSKTLAKELGKYGVRANAVAPGFIRTPILEAMPAKVIEAVTEKPALRRMGQPEEVAAVYAFLASDEGSYITATCINVDGGIILG